MKSPALTIGLVSGALAIGCLSHVGRISLTPESFVELGNRVFIDRQPVSFQPDPLPGYGALAFGALGIASLMFWGFAKDEQQAQPQTAASPALPQSPAVPNQPVVQLDDSEPWIGDVVSLDELQQQAIDLSGSWIDKLIRHPDGQFKDQHYAVNGPTRSGKTVLTEHLIRAIAGKRKASVYLIDPKYLESKPAWSFKPFCKSIDRALEALQHCVGLMIGRQQDADFDPDQADPMFVLIEEWDWIYATWSKPALELLRSLFKVGAGLKVFVILVGQSAQCSAGLKSDDFRQFARVILGREALSFLANPQFSYSNRDELRSQAEQYLSENRRFALVIPGDDLPSVDLVPNLDPQETAVAALERSYSASPPSLPLEYQEAGRMQRAIALHNWAKQKGSVTCRDCQSQSSSPEKRSPATPLDEIRGLLNDLASWGYGTVKLEKQKQIRYTPN